VAARCSTRRLHWRRVGSRAAACKSVEEGGSGTVSSSLLFPARGGFHRDLQQEKTPKQSILFCFLDLSSSSAFSLLCRRFF